MNLPKFKKTVWIYEKYKIKGISALKQKYSLFLDRFYARHRVKERLQQGTLFEDLMKKTEC